MRRGTSMAEYNYAFANGHDQTSLTNVEDVISYAPKGIIIPLGSVKRRTLNKYVQWNGTKVVKWVFAAMSWADFEALILALFGDWDTENALLTIDTRGRDEVFHRGNVVAERPVEGTDYTRQEYGDVEAFTLTLNDFQEVADTGFSIGFSLGFGS